MPVDAPCVPSLTVGQEERRKMREAAVQAAKSFLNPENKPHPSQLQQQSTPAVSSAVSSSSAVVTPSSTATTTGSAPLAGAAAKPHAADRVSYCYG